MHCSALRQVIITAYGEGGAGAGFRVDLGLEAIAVRTAGIDIAYRSIRVIQKALISDSFERKCHHQVARKNLRQTQAIATHGRLLFEIIVTILTDNIIAKGKSNA